MMTLSARLNEIHDKLREGSRAAAYDLFFAALKPIVGYLRRAVPGLAEDEAHDCAVDALVFYLESPEKFDANKSSLWTFLCLIAERDAIDKVRQRADRQALFEKYGYNIELWGAHPNKQHDDSEYRMDAQRIMRAHGHKILQNEAERRVLDLMLEGERSVAAYAQALGIDPEIDDVADQVKRAKDRINMRLKKVRDEL